tara:strand:- start:253 stop:657 length:405 start_codon:yes stop_codon:yes gene_type:complete
MDTNDYKIFDGMTFQDLTKDIYENSRNKKLQLDLLIQELHGFITTIDDAMVIMPVIKEIVDVAVKNDEHLVKLASVIQRIISRSVGGTDDDAMMLTDAEKEELIHTMQDTVDDLQKQSDEIELLKRKKTPFMES